MLSSEYHCRYHNFNAGGCSFCLFDVFMQSVKYSSILPKQDQKKQSPKTALKKIDKHDIEMNKSQAQHQRTKKQI
jgi:hypothetical protein